MAERTAILEMVDFGCVSCAYAIERTGRKLPGVRDIRVDLAQRQIVVSYEEGSADCVARIREVVNLYGHEVRVRMAG